MPAAGAKIIAGRAGDPFDSGVPSCQAEGRVHRRRRALLICFRLITELTPKAFLLLMNGCSLMRSRPAAPPAASGHIRGGRRLPASLADRSRGLRTPNEDHQRKKKKQALTNAWCQASVDAVPLRALVLSGLPSRRSSCTCTLCPSGRWWSSRLRGR